MSCRKEGESEENHRPELMAARSSMLRMGSSMSVCALLLDLGSPALSGAHRRLAQVFVARVSLPLAPRILKSGARAQRPCGTHQLLGGDIDQKLTGNPVACAKM